MKGTRTRITTISAQTVSAICQIKGPAHGCPRRTRCSGGPTGWARFAASGAGASRSDPLAESDSVLDASRCSTTTSSAAPA
jgi:hypothetical protein